MWMLLLLSSGLRWAELSEGEACALFEFGVSAGADLESAEPLVRNAEGRGEDADRNADLLPLCP